MIEPFLIFKNIKKARVYSGLSQKQLAKKLGVSDKTVSAYETGRAIPPTPTLAKLAEITNVALSEIISEQELGHQNSNNTNSERLDKIENRLTSLEQALIKLIKDK